MWVPLLTCRLPKANETGTRSVLWYGNIDRDRSLEAQLCRDIRDAGMQGASYHVLVVAGPIMGAVKGVATLISRGFPGSSRAPASVHQRSCPPIRAWTVELGDRVGFSSQWWFSRARARTSGPGADALESSDGSGMNINPFQLDGHQS